MPDDGYREEEFRQDSILGVGQKRDFTRFQKQGLAMNDSIGEYVKRDFLSSYPLLFHHYLNRTKNYRQRKSVPQEGEFGPLASTGLPNMFHLLKQPNRVPNRNSLMCKMFNYLHPNCWPKKRLVTIIH